jgi:hypothetical protein
MTKLPTTRVLVTVETTGAVPGAPTVTGDGLIDVSDQPAGSVGSLTVHCVPGVRPPTVADAVVASVGTSSTNGKVEVPQVRSTANEVDAPAGSPTICLTMVTPATVTVLPAGPITIELGLIDTSPHAPGGEGSVTVHTVPTGIPVSGDADAVIRPAGTTMVTSRS